VSRIGTHPALERIPHWNALRVGTHPSLDPTHFLVLLCICRYSALERILHSNSSELITCWVCFALELILHWNASRIGTHPAFESIPCFDCSKADPSPVAAVSAKLDPAPDLPTARMPIYAKSLPKFRFHPSLMPFLVCRSAFGATLLFGTSPHCNNPWSFELL